MARESNVHQIPEEAFSLNLKTAVGLEKAVQAIDVHRKFINCVVTFWVMSQFLHFLGASRGCADFRDPTAVFRLKHYTRMEHCTTSMEVCFVRWGCPSSKCRYLF